MKRWSTSSDIRGMQIKTTVRPHHTESGLPGDAVVKNLPAKAGDAGSVPVSRMAPGGGHGNPLQHSCLENPTNRGAWWATVHGVAESDTTEHTRTRAHLNWNG